MRPTSRSMIHELDATGLLCPLPVLKARKRLMAITVGDQLRMRADDPAAVIDVPHFCAESGHKLIESTQDGDVQIYLIEKSG
ncbi:sulfurtransferase TusA family protein [uncultured Sulfitobacter sp.]|uniref:sulfurtransferase TusA family protein n=1 Tax=uncultured Sulfitobacter sp. TaxID=191468 RepID=UPI00262E7645|nr:sulfurtransferase TusA family protein [uncultured Sulfitobacter sp.]